MRVLILAFAAVAGSLVVFAMNDVPAAPTQEDARAISQLLPNEKRHPRAFEEEVALILRVQDRVLAVSPEERGIGLDQPRELQDLIRARHGACFDRSRAIETILRSYGFRTRHAAMYSTVETGSALRALATPDTISHALTEVQTSRGWMIVDSKTRWAGLTSEDRPLDLEAIRANPQRKWSSKVRDRLPEIYGAPFTWVYGLYSRHGRFYPPYNAVPDVNWGELAQNL
jgi:hypothetical protein